MKFSYKVSNGLIDSYLNTNILNQKLTILRPRAFPTHMLFILFQFANLMGTVYRKGNLLFSPDGNSVISPVGNKITVYDLKR